jgi:hypothetical protein
MTHTIRPDVHARFLTLVARADAKVRSEQQAVQKRSSRLLAREMRERARASADLQEDAG